MLKHRFSRNVFDGHLRHQLADVVSPSTSQRPTGAADGAAVRAAIEAGAVQGFFCEALIILEGIRKADRSVVFGGTKPETRYQHGVAPDGNGVTMINIRVEQPDRRPLHQRQADRFLAAFGLRMKLLGATRIGMSAVMSPSRTKPYSAAGWTGT